MTKLYSGEVISTLALLVGQNDFIIAEPDSKVTFAVKYLTPDTYSIHMLFDTDQVVNLVSCGYVYSKGPWLDDLERVIEDYIITHSKIKADSFLSVTGTTEYSDVPSKELLLQYEGRQFRTDIPTYVDKNITL